MQITERVKYMKVGIITFQRADNYGAALQCYALYKSVESIGVDVEVVDYRCPYIERAYLGLPNLQKNLLAWSKKAFTRYKNYEHIKIKHRLFDKLRKKIKFSPEYTKKEIVKNGLDYDLIFTGSDQVWNPTVTNGFDDVYYLNFPGDFVKCSYAASLGNSNSREYQKEKFSALLKKLDMISVREQKASDLIYKIAKRKADVCVDPTLLLSKDEWAQLAAESHCGEGANYILLYYLDENKELIKIAQFIAEKYGAKVICCNKNPVSGQNIEWIGDLGPIDFLSLITNAAAVVSSSFHAAVFSVIFEKQLVATLHPEKGERTKTLAEICGFSSSIYKDYSDFVQRYNKNARVSYDYTSLHKAVEASKAFIKNAVETAQRRTKISER